MEFDETSGELGGGEHICGHVAHSLMHNKPLEEGSSTLSWDFTDLANKAISTMNPTFVIQGNQLFLMNP